MHMRRLVLLLSQILVVCTTCGERDEHVADDDLQRIVEIARAMDGERLRALRHELEAEAEAGGRGGCSSANETEALFARAAKLLGDVGGNKSAWDRGHAALQQVLERDEVAALARLRLLPQAGAADTGGAAGEGSDDPAAGPPPLVLARRRHAHFHQELPCARPARPPPTRLPGAGAGPAPHAAPPPPSPRQFDAALMAQALEPGRVCTRGACSPACSVSVADGVLSAAEAARLSRHARAVARRFANATDDDAKTLVDLSRSAKHEYESVSGSGSISGLASPRAEHLFFMRVLERVRRLAARRFGVPLARLRVASHFVSFIDAGGEAGASGEGAGAATVHADESSFAKFHYSAVLWLNDHGRDFDGGRVHFWRPDARGGDGGGGSGSDADGEDGGNGNGTASAADPRARKRRWLTVEPAAGRLALFSSGWEAIHQVERVVRGARFSLPVFLTTQRSSRFGRACVWPRAAKHWDYCEEAWAQLFG
eukprot:g8286.t1